MDWISVKDRLPDEDATYLVYGRNGYGIVFAIYYGDGEWLTCEDLTNITRFVTHWMPLPKPPKQNETCIQLCGAFGVKENATVRELFDAIEQLNRSVDPKTPKEAHP